jgi:hypothetical protein
MRWPVRPAVSTAIRIAMENLESVMCSSTLNQLNTSQQQ